MRAELGPLSLVVCDTGLEVYYYYKNDTIPNISDFKSAFYAT